jgi:uncharacterized membrane protein HdeD (DUF308 family)
MENFVPYADTLARNWLASVLRGAVAVLFGLLTLFLSDFSLLVLVLAFGGYALADGVLAILSAVRQTQALRWVYVVEGVCGVTLGVFTLLWPGLTLLSLSYVVAARALAAGVLEIAAVIRLGRVISMEWPLGASGALSCVFAVVIVLWPGVDLLTLALWTGIYALLFGAAFTALGLRLRGSHEQRKGRAAARSALGRQPVEGLAHG